MSRTVVLMYHRVAEPAVDAYGLAVAASRFAQHVELLQSLDCVVPLAEVLRPSDALRVAITFDDGYRDNATTAAPLLAEAGLPATWFITSRRVGGQRFWWDRLASALLGTHPLPEALDARVAGQDLWLDLRGLPARDRALRFLHRRLRPLAPDALEATVAQVLEALAAPEPPADEVSMDTEHLLSLAADPLFEIGAHTRTHLQLRGQTPAMQRHEIQGSVDDLATLTGSPVTQFAYPFGSPSAVGGLAPRLAREAGCVLACSTDDGAVTADDDPHLLPRLEVGDWDAARLAQEIAEVTR